MSKKKKSINNISFTKIKKKIYPKLNIYQLSNKLKNIGLKKQTINSMQKIYKDYENFYKNKYNINFNSNNKKSKCVFDNKFYKRSTIKEFINSLENNSIKTRQKKLYILNKTLLELRIGRIKIRNIHSNAKNEDDIFPFKKEFFLNIANEIFISKDINLIIIYQMIFELGISLEQLSKLKIKHIKNDYEYILFKNKGNQIYKVLSFYSYSLLKYNTIQNSLKDEDYVIFNNKNYKNENDRFSFIKNKIQAFLENKKEINQNYKTKFILEKFYKKKI